MMSKALTISTSGWSSPQTPDERGRGVETPDQRHDGIRHGTRRPGVDPQKSTRAQPRAKETVEFGDVPVVVGPAEAAKRIVVEEGTARKVVRPPGILETRIPLRHEERRETPLRVQDQHRLDDLQTRQIPEVLELPERLPVRQTIRGGDEEEAAPRRAQTVDDPVAAEFVLLRTEARPCPVGVSLLRCLGRKPDRISGDNRRGGEQRTRQQGAPEPPAPRR